MIEPFSLLAETETRTYYAMQGLEIWQLALIIVAAVFSLGFIAFMYYLDSVELPAGTTLLLVALRLLAFIGLLVFFLGPEKRTEKKIVKNSRVSVLVDTSLSMGIPDVRADDSSSSDDKQQRIEQIIAELSAGTMLDEMRAEHDVVVYSFDESSKPAEIATLPKLGGRKTSSQIAEETIARKEDEFASGRIVAHWAAGLLALSCLLGVIFFVARRQSAVGGHASWLLLASVLLLVGSFTTLAVANLISSDTTVLALAGLQKPTFDDDDEPEETSEDRTDEGDEQEPIDWRDDLMPRGAETRLGDALRFVINKERGGPAAGIVVFTDGRKNAGSNPRIAVAAARDGNIPIHIVGLGSIQQPQNIRLVEVQAPTRIYPGDNFSITALVQSTGIDGKIDVELRSAQVRAQQPPDDDGGEPTDDGEPSGDGETSDDGEPTEDPDNEPAEETTPPPQLPVDLDDFEKAEGVKIAAGELLPIKFELPPKTAVARHLYTVHVKLSDNELAKDQIETDNEKSAIIEVVPRKNKVMLMAGGPTRDFRFLVSQLDRDPNTQLTVFLQSGRPGMSLASNDVEVIYVFPEVKEELFEYDCIIAFDPDWRQLTKDQIDMLQRWVGEKAGGLVCVAGPVFTPEWTRRPRGDDRMDIIRELYPVSFFHQGATTLKIGRFGGEEAFQLAFTREGTLAKFLWLGDSALESAAAWEEFEGVYGYYAVDRPKKGATILAKFSDPETQSTDGLPIYLAAQFYGAGRTFFQASGELWRIRAVDDRYFEKYYNQLIRWVSQGRLARGPKSHGVLLTDKERCLVSDMVAIRATLRNAQDEPLDLDEVEARLTQPNGETKPLILRSISGSGRRGSFAGQFTATQEGDYRVSLLVPQTADPQLLTLDINARMPDLEIERPERDDELLSGIAEDTSGVYFVGMKEALQGTNENEPLATLIEPNPQKTLLSGNPDAQFTRRLMEWLLALICGVLCVEWLIRRLSRLA